MFAFLALVNFYIVLSKRLNSFEQLFIAAFMHTLEDTRHVCVVFGHVQLVGFFTLKIIAAQQTRKCRSVRLARVMVRALVCPVQHRV